MKDSSSRRPDCTFGSAPSAFILTAYRTALKHFKCALRVLMSAMAESGHWLANDNM